MTQLMSHHTSSRMLFVDAVVRKYEPDEGFAHFSKKDTHKTFNHIDMQVCMT